MTATTWDALCRVLDHALGLPPEARERYLAGLNDPELVGEARRFLAASALPHPLVERIDADGPALVEEVLMLAGPLDDGPEPGTFAGPYRLDARVGQGGHGTVYRAHDVDADRTVAVKLLASRRDDVYDRLRREVRALARLDHPHVARFYSAGKLDDGRAFFAMEWVDGLPITAFAGAHALSFEARLRLFRQLAAAVQHAHERLVLHRDLKPDNVLVVDTPNGPAVKVVDLGIGKVEEDAAPADDPPLPYLRLTPAYAAPEQLRGEPASVASDLYSLAVVGRDLLFAPAPPRTEAERDIEAVLARSLAHDPADRYATVGAMADEVRRAAEGQVVTARSVGRMERTRRFVRRNRGGVLRGSLAMAAFLLATGLYLGSLADARARAEREAAAAEEAVTMLTGVFAQADPFSDRGDTIRVRQIVAAAAANLRARPPESPEGTARVACALARVYTSLEMASAAAPLYATCLSYRSDGATPAWYLAALGSRAALARTTGDVAGALGFSRQALVLATRDAGPLSAERADALVALGEAHTAASRFDSAAAVLERGVALTRQTYGANSTQTSAALAAYAGALLRLGRLDEAEAAAREAIAIETALHGARHPLVAQRLAALGALLNQSDRIPEADSVLRQARALFASALGPDHPSTLEAEAVLAENRRLSGDPAGAYDDYTRLYARLERRLGPDNPRVLALCASVGTAERRMGRAPAAVDRLGACARRADRALGPSREATLLLYSALGFALYDAGRFADCEATFRDLVPRFRRVLRDHPYVWQTHVATGNCALEQRDADPAKARVAEAEARIAVDGLAGLVAPENRVYLGATGLLGRSLSVQHRWTEAEAVLAARAEVVRRALPEGDATRAAALADLAAMRTSRGVSRSR